MIPRLLGVSVAAASGGLQWWNASSHTCHNSLCVVNPVTQPWRELLLHVEVIRESSPTSAGTPVLLTRVVSEYIGTVEQPNVEVVLADVPEQVRTNLSPGDRLIVAGRGVKEGERWLLLPVEPAVDLQRLQPISVFWESWKVPHEQLCICPLQHQPPEECPSQRLTEPDRPLWGYTWGGTWFGNLHEQYRGQTLILDPDLRRSHTMPGTPEVAGWPPIRRPVPDLLFEHPVEEAFWLADAMVYTDIETMECDLAREETCIARGDVVHAYSGGLQRGQPFEAAVPPEFCPFVPGHLRELLFLDATDGPVAWEVVDMAISGSYRSAPTGRERMPGGGYGVTSRGVHGPELPEDYRFDPGILPDCDVE